MGKKLAATGIISLLAMAQTPQGKELTAREMFYAARDAATTKPAAAPARTRRPAARPANPAAPPAPASAPRTETASRPAPTSPTGVPIVSAAMGDSTPLGLRYTVSRADSEASEIRPDSVFHSGDRIRLSVEPSDSGYLYIISRGSSGTWSPLFPSAGVENGNNRVEAGQTYAVPPGSVITFVGEPGVEKLFIVLSRQPEKELDGLIYSLQSPSPVSTPSRTPPPSEKTLVVANIQPIGDDVVDRLRVYSRDLVVEKLNEDQPKMAGKKADKSVYVVNPKGRPDSRVIADLTLRHE